MLRLRPYKPADAAVVLSWCKDQKTFYQWTAGMLGDYPAAETDFAFVESLIPFTAFDETGILGFFTLRTPNGSPDELRFGFVIVSPERRGTGCGKAMLRLGLKFAFELYGARRASLGVFENNPAAYSCYKAAGFHDVVLDKPERYHISGEAWTCRELAVERYPAVLHEPPVCRGAANHTREST